MRLFYFLFLPEFQQGGGGDGFGAADNRTQEMQKVFNLFTEHTGKAIVSITNTTYDIPSVSVYGL